MKRLLSLVAAFILAAPASAETIVITDGDTIKVEGEIYRLWGIDAPEARQACRDGWPAGRVATEAMQRFVLGHQVVCEYRGHDRYRRTIGLCKADGHDLSLLMVKTGMAWAYVRYSQDYIEDERRAEKAKRGIHAHDCLPAWEWRAQRRH